MRHYKLLALAAMFLCGSSFASDVYFVCDTAKGTIKQKLHDFTGCIINVDQCGTGWSSAFKPVMIAAIDLYQFARTRTPVTWLRDPCGAELQADITIEPLQR